MNKENREEIIRYLIDRTPIMLDIEHNDLKYDSRNINYKIYKYIKDLEEENRKDNKKNGK